MDFVSIVICQPIVQTVLQQTVNNCLSIVGSRQRKISQHFFDMVAVGLTNRIEQTSNDKIIILCGIYRDFIPVLVIQIEFRNIANCINATGPCNIFFYSVSQTSVVVFLPLGINLDRLYITVKHFS